MAVIPDSATVSYDARLQSLKHRRLLLSALSGSAIEWYDFGLYGLLAPAIFDKLFFPRESPLIGTILVMSIFAVGFIGRPVGGLIFAHFGDKLGRKPMMVVTMSLIGIASTLMGFIPPYATIGMAAPIILTLLRFIQGCALGGESTGAPILTMESAPHGRRGLFASIAQMGAACGAILASVAAQAVSYLPHDQLMEWGWRLPFIASIGIVGIGLYIRLKVDESPAFVKRAKEAGVARFPLLEVLRRAPKPALIVFLCALTESSIAFLAGIYGLQYGIATLHIPRVTLLQGGLIGMVLCLFIGPFCGWLADRVGRRPLMLTGFILAALNIAFVFFGLLQTRNTYLVMAAMAFSPAILTPLTLCVEGSFYAELFTDARLRYSGNTLGRQFGTAFGGGLMPVIATGLVAAMGGSLLGVKLYFCFLAVFAIGAVLLAPETKDRTI
ncbi:MAG TPA: MFS transporter [Stellaceae bacterium]|nr:MFS transporter [Stellaceae bacterium]